jgi:hypothetical protein
MKLRNESSAPSHTKRHLQEQKIFRRYVTRHVSHVGTRYVDAERWCPARAFGLRTIPVIQPALRAARVFDCLLSAFEGVVPVTSAILFPVEAQL